MEGRRPRRLSPEAAARSTKWSARHIRNALYDDPPRRSEMRLAASSLVALAMLARSVAGGAAPLAPNHGDFAGLRSPVASFRGATAPMAANRSPPLRWTPVAGAQQLRRDHGRSRRPWPRAFRALDHVEHPGDRDQPAGRLGGRDVSGVNGDRPSAAISVRDPPSGVHHYHLRVFALNAALSLGARRRSRGPGPGDERPRPRRRRADRDLRRAGALIPGGEGLARLRPARHHPARRRPQQARRGVGQRQWPPPVKPHTVMPAARAAATPFRLSSIARHRFGAAPGAPRREGRGRGRACRAPHRPRNRRAARRASHRPVRRSLRSRNGAMAGAGDRLGQRQPRPRPPPPRPPRPGARRRRRRGRRDAARGNRRADLRRAPRAGRRRERRRTAHWPCQETAGRTRARSYLMPTAARPASSTSSASTSLSSRQPSASKITAANGVGGRVAARIGGSYGTVPTLA